MQREQKSIPSLITFFILTASIVFSAAPIRMARFPAPSPDGQKLAFSYHGDLWTVPMSGGKAIRLTVHEAYDHFPVWSPDGKEIAFSSNRFGNDDIFVIPSEGGIPERLTFFSGYDRMCDWSADGKMLYFTSHRDFYYHRMPVMYKVERKNSGTPTMLVAEYADHGKISPDGKYFVFARGREAWYRKHYRGSSACDIWLYEFKTGTFQKLTSHPGNDWQPMWSKDSKIIFYVTDKGDDTFNLWRMDFNGGNKKQLTFHKDDGARFPNISRSGEVIAYERGVDIWIYSVAKNKTQKIDIIAPSDLKNNLVEQKIFADKASELKVSPDEKKAAFVVRGDIFLTSLKGKGKTGKTMALTDTPARERGIFWAPNSDTLLYISDRNGTNDIFMIYSADPAQKDLAKTLKYKEKLLAGTQESETDPQFSPDGKKIAYIRGKGDLHIMDADGKNDRTILQGWAGLEYTWSPDGKWIAYSRADNEFNYDIFIMPADGGEAVNVTQHPDDDNDLFWSQDGQKLAYVSRRFGNTNDIWYVYLQKSDEEKTKEDWQDEDEAKEKKKKDEEKKDEKVQVKIDFKDIHKRQHRLTSLPGDEASPVISPDGKILVFSASEDGKRDLYKINWDGSELKRLTNGGVSPSFIQFGKDGKTIFYLSKGRVHSISSEGKDAKSLAFKAKMKIDLRAERAQKFDEAWMILNENFYDPHFHGADWKTVKKKYRPLALEAATIDEFNNVVRLMLGELNASHLGISGPAEGPRVSTGMLGLRFDERYKGKGLKIAGVMPKGPCDLEKSKVFPGEMLLSIDDVEINENTNIYKLLNDKVDEKVRIEIQNQDKTSKRTLVVRPVSYGKFVNLEYERWVNAKREITEEESHGKIGYIHIRSMSDPNIEQFETELYSEAHGKDGLVIDVRNNGGGWITDYLLAMLSVKPHAYTIPRDGGKGYPQGRLPLYYWSKPIVVICNEWSFSNAEIFPHAIKNLKRGKIVGAPTGGLVISTGGTTLIDGASFRIPFRGWYALYSGLDEENHGCIPDVIIWDKPGDAAKGIDRQLAKAVQVLSGEIK